MEEFENCNYEVVNDVKLLINVSLSRTRLFPKG